MFVISGELGGVEQICVDENNIIGTMRDIWHPYLSAIAALHYSLIYQGQFRMA